MSISFDRCQRKRPGPERGLLSCTSFAVAIALLGEAGCAHCQNEFSVPILGACPTPEEWHPYQPTAHDIKARHIRAMHAFRDGATCICSDQTCGVFARAREFCGQKGADCVDEILMHATQGGLLQLRTGTPRILVRIGVVLSVNGQPRQEELNHVPVMVDDGRTIVLRPTGSDLGRMPHGGPFEIKLAQSPEADIAVDGVEYKCQDAPTN